MAGSRKRKGSANLADELQLWASHHGIDGDAYVSQLVDALRTGDQLDYWSRYDNLDLLPATSSNAGQRELRLSEALINFRNIMVFVPVAFTWAGIGQATTAFSKYASSNANKVVNFFDFWENGYGVLNQFWTLSNIARVDFLLLTLVIIASSLITLFQSQAKRLISRSEKMDDQERLALALKLNLFLHDFRAPTSTIVNQGIAQSITNLRKSSGELLKTSKILDKSSQKMTKSTPISSQLSAIKKLLDKKQK